MVGLGEIGVVEVEVGLGLDVCDGAVPVGELVGLEVAGDGCGRGLGEA